MSKKEKQCCDVLIIGGGVPGVTLAALLEKLGLETVVIDPQPPVVRENAPYDGRTVALMAGSVNILKAAGLWKNFEGCGEYFSTLKIIESKNAQAEFHADDIGLPYFGVNIPNAAMRAYGASRVRKAELIEFSVDDFGITAKLDDGKSIRARLLVGADGRNSRTRELCGIDVWRRDYRQSAITCLIDHTRAHGHISTEFHRPGGPFTLVPLPGHRSSVVWVEYATDAEKFMHLRRQDFEAALQDRTEGLLGKITAITPPACWPLIALRARALTAPRTALIAEAAHVVSPLGAQGLNLSLRDVAALAETIAGFARNGLDIGSKAMLDRYAFRRRADIMTRLAGTDALTLMVSNNIGLLHMLRSAGLKTINSFESLRHLAMNEGVLPGYDESRLARGEAI